MSAQEPDIIQTDADWDWTYYFFSSADESVPRDLTGYSMSGALTQLGSDVAPFLISSGAGHATVVGNAVTIHVTEAQKTAIPVSDELMLEIVLISPTGVREGGYWFPYRNLQGAAA